MFALWVFLAYAAALALALYLLHGHVLAWYWHLVGVAAALGLGFMPPLPWQGRLYDLVLGSVIVFLLIWGVGGVLMFRTHHPRHA